MFTYDASRNLSMVPGLQNSVFQATDALLRANGGLQFCVGRIRGGGCSESGAAAILHHVLMRTLRFNKLFEHIRVREIMNGMQELSVAPVPLCDRQVRRSLDVLVERGFLVELKGDGGKAQFLGLNLPFIISRLRERWQGATFRTEAGNMIHERLQVASEAFGESMRRFYEFVHNKAVGCWDAFLEEAREAFGGILSRMRSAMNDASSSVGRESNTLEERRGEPSLNGNTGVRCWKKLMEDAGYSEAIAINERTGGMMKNYLKELRANGMRDEQIREYFRRIVEGWARISGMPFETRDQKRATAPAIPEFEYFYKHRSALLNILHVQALKVGNSTWDEAY
jgi:hypothetical protein